MIRRCLHVNAADIIFSPLKDLRDSIQTANEGDTGFFLPQRDLNLNVGLPTIVVFAQNDTRLLVGSDNGSIHVYDTAMLFSPGDGFVAPLHTYNPQYGALRQIAPNPGTESDLVDKLAVVRSDGVVQLMNTNLESLGGWSCANPDGNPVAGEYLLVDHKRLVLNQLHSFLVSKGQTPCHRSPEWRYSNVCSKQSVGAEQTSSCGRWGSASRAELAKPWTHIQGDIRTTDSESGRIHSTIRLP